MATVQEQIKPAPGSKYDAFVEAQLQRARRRIRTLDTAGALLGFVAGTLVFVLFMALLEPVLRQAAAIQWTLCLGFAGVALVYLGVFVVWPWCRRVNLHYAAREVERDLPNAKNSVMNWLDLRRRQLPPSILSALSHRAAKDLSHVDLERAISARRTLWLTGITSTLALAVFFGLLLLGAERFGHAFALFAFGTPQTHLEIVKPVGGDATVLLGQSMDIVVQVDRILKPNKPESPRLHFQRRPSDPFEVQLLERRTEREWLTTIPGNRVQSGFWYKVTAGDTETPVYQVKVRAAPLVDSLDVTYHYRPYLCKKDETFLKHPGALKAYRGTEVTLVAHTNRVVKEGRLDLETADGKKSVPAALIVNDPQALRFRFVLDHDGKYAISFTAREGDSNPDPIPYGIQIIPDYPPIVRLQKPGEDITLPANGVLAPEGQATDDIGVKSMTLRMRRVDGLVLEPKAYRSDKDFRLADGSYPRELDYKDHVELAKLKDADGKPFPLQAGTVLEYWLEAADNCDYPNPNIGESRHFKVTITEPEKDPRKQQQDRDQAERSQRDHDTAQDQKLDQENQAIQDRQKTEEQTSQDQANRQEDPKTKQPEKPTPEQEKQNEQARNQAEKLADDLSRKEQEEKRPAENKSDSRNEPKGKDKGDGQGASKPDAGKSKSEGGGSKQEAGKQKTGGTGQPGQPKPGDGKNEGQGEQNQAKADAKDQQGQAAKQPAGDSKGMGQSQPTQNKAEAKGESQPASQQTTGQSKGDNPGQPMSKPEKSAAKGTGQGAGAAGQQPQGLAKDESPAPDKSEAKSDGKRGTAGAEPKGKPKDGTKPGPGSIAQGEQKPAGPAKGAGDSVAKADKKGDGQSNGGGKPLSEDVKKEINDLAQSLKSDDPQKRDAASKRIDEMVKKGKELSEANGKKDPENQLSDEGKKELNDLMKKLLAARREQQEKDGTPDPNQAATASAKNPPKDQGQPGSNSGSPATEPKKPPTMDTQGAGAQKTGGSNQEATAEAKNAGMTPAQNGSQSNDPGKKGDTPGEAKGKTGNTAKDQGYVDPGTGFGTSTEPAPADSLASSEPDPRHRLKATVLQLEAFKNNPRYKQTLGEMKLSEAEFDRLLQANRELLKQQEADEKLVSPQQGGALPNQGSRLVDPGSKSKTGDVKYGGPALPPPQFRDAYREFTKKMSDAERIPEKK